VKWALKNKPSSRGSHIPGRRRSVFGERGEWKECIIVATVNSERCQKRLKVKSRCRGAKVGMQQARAARRAKSVVSAVRPNSKERDSWGQEQRERSRQHL